MKARGAGRGGGRGGGRPSPLHGWGLVGSAFTFLSSQRHPPALAHAGSNHHLPSRGATPAGSQRESAYHGRACAICWDSTAAWLRDRSATCRRCALMQEPLNSLRSPPMLHWAPSLQLLPALLVCLPRHNNWFVCCGLLPIGCNFIEAAWYPNSKSATLANRRSTQSHNCGVAPSGSAQ